MKTITSKEFAQNIDEYDLIAQEEEIMVTDDNGQPIYYIEPYKVKKLKDIESIFGVLPEETTCERE